MAWAGRFSAAMVACMVFFTAVGATPGSALVELSLSTLGYLLAMVGLSAAYASAPRLRGEATQTTAIGGAGARPVGRPSVSTASADPRAGSADAAAPDPEAAARRMKALTAAAVAEWSARAKERDDQHKAESLAHARRPVPPLGDEGRAVLAAALEAHVAIRHLFPPRLPQRGLSYLGGSPIAPDDLDWPLLHNTQGLLERLNFVAQIDCADLPPEAARHLPKSGILYFFAPLAGSFGPEAYHSVVRYLPGPVTKRWTPQQFPFVGAIEPDDEIARVWPGKRSRFDRVEVAFGWIAEAGDEEVAARAAEGFPHEVGARIVQERLDAFYGTPPEDTLLSTVGGTDEVWWPYAEFPHNWKAARVLRIFVDAWVRASIAAATTAAAADPSDEARRRVEALRLMQSRLSRAFFPSVNAGLSDAAAPSAEQREQMREAMQLFRDHGEAVAERRRLREVVRRWIRAAAVAGAELGVADPAGVEHVPASIVAALGRRHGSRAHRMLGAGEVVQVAADEMRERYVLLLQLGADEALGWWPGEMGPLQYWITPEDLAARRFEHTVLTVEAY